MPKCVSNRAINPRNVLASSVRAFAESKTSSKAPCCPGHLQGGSPRRKIASGPHTIGMSNACSEGMEEGVASNIGTESVLVMIVISLSSPLLIIVCVCVLLSVFILREAENNRTEKHRGSKWTGTERERQSARPGGQGRAWICPNERR